MAMVDVDGSRLTAEVSWLGLTLAAAWLPVCIHQINLAMAIVIMPAT